MTRGERGTAQRRRWNHRGAKLASRSGLVFGAFLAIVSSACTPGSSGRSGAPPGGTLEAYAHELDALTDAGFRRGGEPTAWTAERRATFAGVLEESLADDERSCAPDPREVFASGPPDGERIIRGAMPHYGFFYGPMRYRIARGADGGAVVRLTIAVDLHPTGGALALSGCPVARALDPAHASCRGVPASVGQACPDAGAFTVPDTLENERRLLARWSAAATRLYERDAKLFGLRVAYEILFADARALDPVAVDATVPLDPTCGRTPYFQALRSGWSVSVVAHEAGHWMGLLDEYEALSGIVRPYPKTPFPGADKSRMGLSNDPLARVLPVHHYLVLRRAFCADPRADEPFGRALP
jgi:hypothetical protein